MSQERQAADEPDDLDALLEVGLEIGFADEPSAKRPQSDGLGDGIPSRIGRFEPRITLDRGGLGVVLRAYDPELEREVAIKLLRRSAQDMSSLSQIFVSEARMLARLQHPAIVPVHETGRLPDGRAFFVMHLIEGKNLSKHLAERVSIAEELPKWIRVFLEVSQALAFAHDSGVLHRDVKPANVMLGQFGEVRLIDWGFSALPIQSADGKTQFVGTPAYVSPEQARRESESLTPRSDVFSLGALLCEILTGEPPFMGPDSHTTLQHAAQGRIHDAYERIASCTADQALKSLATSCLSVDPTRRPAHAGEVAENIQSYLDRLDERAQQLAVEAAANAARAEQEKRLRQRTLRGGLVLLALALSIAAFGIYTYIREQELKSGIASSLERTQREVTWARAHATADPKGWQSALKLAQETLVRAEAQGEDSKLATQARRLRTQADEGLQQAERDAEFLSQIAAVFEQHFGEESWRDPVDMRQLFASNGFDIDRQSPKEVATRIRQSPLRASLTDALDDWLLWTATSRRDEMAKLVTIANLVDDQPKRQAIRLALLESNYAPAVEIAQEKNLGEYPPETLRLLARILLRGDRTDLAQIVLKSSVRFYPGDYGSCHDLANLLAKGNAPEAAVEPAWMAVALRPQDDHAWSDLCTILLNAGSFTPAVHAADKCLALNQANWSAHCSRAYAMLRLGNDAEALHSARQALGLRPQNPDTLLILQGALSASGKMRAARELLKKALDTAPASATLIAAVAAHYLECGELRSAKEALAKGLEIHPEDHNLLARLARAHSIGRGMKAIQFIEKALLLAPEQPTAQFTAGLVFEDLSDYSRAKVHYLRAQAATQDSKGWIHKTAGLRKDVVTSILVRAQTLENFDADELLKLPQLARWEYACAADLAGKHLLASRLYNSVDASCGYWNGFRAARSAALLSSARSADGQELSERRRERWGRKSRVWLLAEVKRFSRLVFEQRRFRLSITMARVKHDPAFSEFKSEDAPDEWREVWQAVDGFFDRLLAPSQ